MAHVTGPITTLPGYRHPFPEGTVCDGHADRPAVARIQGETDSMGSELNDLCQECLEGYEREQAATREAEKAGMVLNWCDHCRAMLYERVWPTRDPDEGQAGPVYDLSDEHRRRLFAYHREG